MDKCNLIIDEKKFSFDVVGKFNWGKDEFLYNSETNILSKTNFIENGYSIINLFSDLEFKDLIENTKKNILDSALSNGLNIPKDFLLENYHHYIKNFKDHNKIISKTKVLRKKNFNFDLDKIASIISKIVGIELSFYNPDLKTSHIQLRINRPQSSDFNPPHKDSYIDCFNDVVNIWIPICGCDSSSSLPLMPGSHLLNESELFKSQPGEAKINNITYNVPCILKTKNRFFKLIRPNPNIGDAILFSPYLIHGAAFNNNSDITRIALELRLSRK